MPTEQEKPRMKRGFYDFTNDELLDFCSKWDERVKQALIRKGLWPWEIANA